MGRWRIRTIPVLWLLVLAATTGIPALSPASPPGFTVEGGIDTATAARWLARYDLDLTPPVDRPTADDAAFYLREALLRDGHPEALVSYEVIDGRVRFTVDSGPRILLGRILLDGSRALDPEHERMIFLNIVRQVTLTPFGPPPFVLAAVEAGAERLRAAYASHGYLDAVVTFEDIPRHNRIDVSLSITPGPLHRITRLEVVGAEEPPEISSARGGKFHPGESALLRLRLLDALRSDGHLDARVTESTTISPDGDVAIRLVADPGPRFQLGEIRLEGLRRTHKEAVLGRLGLSSGKPFNAREVNEAMKRLWITGAFKEINDEVKRLPDGTAELELNFQEAAAKDIAVTLGYGQWDLAFGEVTYTDRNLFGTLNRLTLGGFASTRRYAATAQLTDPNLFASDVAGTLGAYFVRQETPAYRSNFYGGTIGIERLFDLRGSTGWRVGYEWRAIDDTTVFGGDEGDGEEYDYQMGRLSFGQTLDRRNDPLVPMDGYFLSWDAAVASKLLGGDVSFSSVVAQATYYLPFLKVRPERPYVPFMVFNHRAGLQLPFDGTDAVPIQERFYLGGPETVRSFQLDGMAPRASNGVPLGGQVFLLGNVELQIPVAGPVYLIGFLDVGNLASELSALDWEETRLAAGMGARLYTPLGAVRFDYGYNLIRGEGDPVGAWQFGFGFTF
ncbi:MAG: outer membrane protein assembly factor BamA [Terrimicrobiaceae bacterium]